MRNIAYICIFVSITYIAITYTILKLKPFDFLNENKNYKICEAVFITLFNILFSITFFYLLKSNEPKLLRTLFTVCGGFFMSICVLLFIRVYMFEYIVTASYNIIGILSVIGTCIFLYKKAGLIDTSNAKTIALNLPRLFYLILILFCVLITYLIYNRYLESIKTNVTTLVKKDTLHDIKNEKGFKLSNDNSEEDLIKSDGFTLKFSLYLEPSQDHFKLSEGKKKDTNVVELGYDLDKVDYLKLHSTLDNPIIFDPSGVETMSLTGIYGVESVPTDISYQQLFGSAVKGNPINKQINAFNKYKIRNNLYCYETNAFNDEDNSSQLFPIDLTNRQSYFSVRFDALNSELKMNMSKPYNINDEETNEYTIEIARSSWLEKSSGTLDDSLKFILEIYDTNREVLDLEWDIYRISEKKDNSLSSTYVRQESNLENDSESTISSTTISINLSNTTISNGEEGTYYNTYIRDELESNDRPQPQKYTLVFKTKNNIEPMYIRYRDEIKYSDDNPNVIQYNHLVKKVITLKKNGINVGVNTFWPTWIYMQTYTDPKELYFMKGTCYDHFIKYKENASDDNLIKIEEKNGIKWYQKWNDVVLNYEAGIMKVYVNNVLKEEKEMVDESGNKINLNLNAKNLRLFLGDSNKSSVNGHIKNAYFFTKSLSRSKLELVKRN